MQKTPPKTLATLILTAALLAAPMARAESEGTPDAARTEQITAALVALGYDVRRLALEDGMIEAYAVKDGQTCEVYLTEALTLDHQVCS